MSDEAQTLQERVTNAVSAVCPNDGISFGNLTDKHSWSIQFCPEATPEQLAAAQSVIDEFSLEVA
jgi:hypothetical protein